MGVQNVATKMCSQEKSRWVGIRQFHEKEKTRVIDLLNQRPWLATEHLPVTGLQFLPGSDTRGPREELGPCVTGTGTVKRL